ncbi:hypothetical protein EVAR_11985_1 [Eumeta japonica]|uniref:Uncharacterized protein n=1 Tax=Eumeta variegata TaxID=151549 RepID=A0A4C1U5X4_EUMVA|nr:hypothetical protein EVAR_11985_1 [Eumeta japonica]
MRRSSGAHQICSALATSAGQLRRGAPPLNKNRPSARHPSRPRPRRPAPSRPLHPSSVTGAMCLMQLLFLFKYTSRMYRTVALTPVTYHRSRPMHAPVRRSPNNLFRLTFMDFLCIERSKRRYRSLPLNTRAGGRTRDGAGGGGS